MYRETNCKHYEECLENGVFETPEFDCNNCDGTEEHARVLGLKAKTVKISPPSPEKAEKVCRGNFCMKMNKYGVTLPISFFGKNKARPDGRQVHCKKCTNAKAKQVYKAKGRPDRIKKKQEAAPSAEMKVPETNPRPNRIASFLSEIEINKWQNHSILEFLKEYHTNQIAHINKAMAALKGD